MASDQAAVAFERLAEVADEDRRPAGAPASDLAELASALAQVEALVAAGAEAGPDAAAALERIADIAFVLHEREVEPSLCDALDAAMRDISEANARNRTNVQRAHEAAQLLRALAQRIEAMMAAQAQDHASRSTAGAELECADEFPAPARLFGEEVPEDGAFARTVAALAESLPQRSDAAPAQFLDQVADSGAVLEALMPADGAPVQETSPSAEAHAAETVSGPVEQESLESVTPASVTLPSSDPVAVASPASSAVAAPPVDMNRSIDPDEDPGDLFEPMTDMQLAAGAPEPAPVAAVQETAPPANLVLQSPRRPASAPAPAASRPAANDPLAPIRALSEEELIALFS
jgi:hypothetical protein